MNRVSIRFSRTEPGTSGATRGRSCSDTKHAAGFGWLAVYGSTMSTSGGSNAWASNRANTSLGHGDLVVGDGQAALGDVEHPGGGAAVVRGVVQHAVDEPVAGQQRGGEAVAVEGQRQLAGQARLIEDERAPGELGQLLDPGQVVVEERLDASVRGAEPVGQAPAQLALSGEDRLGEAG